MVLFSNNFLLFYKFIKYTCVIPVNCVQKSVNSVWTSGLTYE